MKYIFLDYDGVIAPFSRNNKTHQDSSVCMGYLSDILDLYPETYIVLTTDNRYSYSFDELKAWFPEDVAERIIGMTTIDMYHPKPSDTEERISLYGTDTRDREIALYINEHDLDPDDCIAIDDVWEITCIKMVKTESEVGLTEAHVDQICEWFSGDMVTLQEF